MERNDGQFRQRVGCLSSVMRGVGLARLCLAFVGWLLPGCGNPAQFNLNVFCSDAQALQRVTRISVWVVLPKEGLCDQFDTGQLDPSTMQVLSRLSIDRSLQSGGTIPQLPAGELVFMAEGYAQDKVALRGCSLVRFVPDRSQVVTLELFVRCGADSDCDDGDRCTQDACVRGRCQVTPMTAEPTCGPQPQPQPCTDPATCPVVSVDPCQGVDCRHLDSACQVGACDPATGQCAAQKKPDGTVCDDQNLCTQNDTCQTGQCKGAAKSCTQQDSACQVGACAPATGQCVAENRPNGTSCNDNLYCTLSDSCQSGQCKGTARDCSAVADACSTGVCSETAKACQKVLKADPNAAYVQTTGLTRYACSSYPGIGSCDSLTSTSISFTNPSPVSMNIYWLDYSGVLSLYGTLSPGQSMGMGTFYTHPWLIRDTCGNCMTIYVKGTPCWY